MLKTSKVDTLVIGGGISGCAASQQLQANNADYLLIEKNTEMGGLTRSISIGDALFDYTGHFLHLTKYKSPEDIPFAHQKDSNWQRVERKSAVFIDGRIVPAPFQYNLFSLPAKLRERCIRDYRTRPIIEEPVSFADYLLTGFGQGMCDLFLFPYNEKIQATDLNSLSIDAVKRFFPSPDEEKIENGYLRNNAGVPDGYNSNFWYPIKEGIGVLAKGLAKNLIRIQHCCPLQKIDLKNRRAQTSLGDITYRHLITSIPLKKFCSITTNSKLHELSEKLSHNKVFCLNVYLSGDLPKKFKDIHWIYIPDKNIPVDRVGIYSHVPNSHTPSSHTAIYIETAYSHQDKLPPIHSLVNDTLSSLEKLNWLRKEDCKIISANWIDCGYVHFTHEHQYLVNKIIAILKENDAHPIGRYGLWDYTSMEDSIISGVNIANKLSNNDDI